MNAQVIEQRKKAAAEMLLKCVYPNDILEKMISAFQDGDFDKVQSIASQHDIKKREELDSKITMFPNPDFQEDIDITKINEEIKEKFLDILASDKLSRLLEQGEQITLRNEELSKLEPVECEDTNPRFLFKVEGIDEVFKSASKAIKAYRQMLGEPQDKDKEHKFRRTIVLTENPYQEEIDALQSQIESANEYGMDTEVLEQQLQRVLEESKKIIEEVNKKNEATLCRDSSTG